MPATLPVSYTTVSLMFVTLPDIGSVTTLTSAHLANFAGQAESEINAKLARAYSLPFTAEIPLLQTLATDLALYKVLTRRLFTSERLEASPWPDRYKEARETLTWIAAGELPLVDSSGAVLQGRSDIAEVYSTTKNYVPTFWEGPTGDQIQDADKIDDEADRRDLTIRDQVL